MNRVKTYEDESGIISGDSPPDFNTYREVTDNSNIETTDNNNIEVLDATE